MPNRFNRLDNQAPAQTQIDSSKPIVGRSVFDFSRVHSGNTLLYALTPVDCFDVVPGEDLSIAMANYLEFRNPSVRPLLNGFRVYFHAYYNRLVDLWEGAKNFLDTGRSGQISLNRPNLIYHVNVTREDSSVYEANACTPMSLLNFLGLPVEAYSENSSAMDTPLFQFHTAADYYNLNNSQVVQRCQSIGNSPDFFPADCVFAYQRNWRDFYSNKNLLQNNKYWFPDNEDHFILSYSCENACAISYENEDFSNSTGEVDENVFANLTGYPIDQDSASDFRENFWELTPEPNNPITSANDWDNPIYEPNLSGLKFRQFRGDRFTSALPFPDLIRGEIPALTSDGTSAVTIPGLGIVNKVDFKDQSGSNHVAGSLYAISYNDSESAAGSFGRLGYNTKSDGSGSNYVQSYTASNRKNIPLVTKETTVQLRNLFHLTQNDIRALETYTVFKERMARTNGDYNDMIEAQYGVNPRVHDRRGTYIGGFYQDFNLNVVTQVSESTESSPLGRQAATMYSNGQGNIGNFHVTDFGWIQIYMSIVHDVMYTQGIERQFSKKVQTDMYFPIFNNLAPQAILNKELFVSGVSNTDNDVFAYEDRYAEYKSRVNRVSGFMGLSHSLAAFDSARIMSRRFESTPSLNSLFVTGVPENIDMDVFTVVDEPPFDFSCGISVRRVFPGPYTAVPGALSSNLHA